MAKSIKSRKPHDTLEQRGRLADEDISLIAAMIWLHMGTQGPIRVMPHEVFTLAPEVRHRLCATVYRMKDADTLRHDKDRKIASAAAVRWHRLCAELHALCRRHGRRPSLADGFIMSADEWKRVYIDGGR